MTNIQLLVMFFFEGLIWLIIFFLFWCLVAFVRLYYLHQKAKNYKCPKYGCEGCNYLDGYVSNEKGIVWECKLHRDVKLPWFHQTPKGGC